MLKVGLLEMLLSFGWTWENPFFYRTLFGFELKFQAGVFAEKFYKAKKLEIINQKKKITIEHLEQSRVTNIK